MMQTGRSALYIRDSLVKRCDTSCRLGKALEALGRLHRAQLSSCWLERVNELLVSVKNLIWKTLLYCSGLKTYGLLTGPIPRHATATSKCGCARAIRWWRLLLGGPKLSCLPFRPTIIRRYTSLYPTFTWAVSKIAYSRVLSASVFACNSNPGQCSSEPYKAQLWLVVITEFLVLTAGLLVAATCDGVFMSTTAVLLVVADGLGVLMPTHNRLARWMDDLGFFAIVGKTGFWTGPSVCRILRWMGRLFDVRWPGGPLLFLQMVNGWGYCTDKQVSAWSSARTEWSARISGASASVNDHSVQS